MDVLGTYYLHKIGKECHYVINVLPRRIVWSIQCSRVLSGLKSEKSYRRHLEGDCSDNLTEVMWKNEVVWNAVVSFAGIVMRAKEQQEGSRGGWGKYGKAK
jgi:hypothetical protein